MPNCGVTTSPMITSPLDTFSKESALSEKTHYKVVHFTNNLSDGAGRAAYRLHKALLGQGVESLMLVFEGGCSDDTVIEISGAHITKPAIKSNKDILYRGINLMSFISRKVYWKLKSNKWKPLTLFNLNIPFVSINRIQKYLQDVEIICIHSIQAFLSSRLIRDIYLVCKAPIVWTPLDIEPLTGGCHFNNGCMRFTQSCGNCPQLGNGRKGDISKRIWSQKKKDLKNIPITFVAGSSWVLDHIESSSLFGSKRTKKIFLSVDQNVFTKVDKEIAREILQLPKEKKIILFGAFNLNDKRKGGQYLLTALKKLNEKLRCVDENLCDSVILLTIGRQNGFKADDMPFNWIHLGEVRDDGILSLVYQASDVLASPSVDDFGPMMVNEAFMCATPIVAFNVGVAPDLLKLRKVGYLAKNYSVDDFSSGLFQCLFGEIDCNNDEDLELREECRPSNQAKHYISLFEELLVKEDFMQYE